MTIPNMGVLIPSMGTTKQSKPASARTAGSVADALFSKVQQRVLGVLFGNPSRTFYANEVISLAQSGTGAVQRELARLEDAGLIVGSRVGNQKHYQANSRAPVFGELRALVLKTSGVGDTLRSALAGRRTEIRAAFVFGSVAKQEDTAESDIDVMVLSDTLGYADLFATLEPAGGALRRKVNPTIYTFREFQRRVRAKNAFVMRVIAQPKIWLLGGESDLTA